MNKLPATAERNAPCPCGSGKKYKSCCLRKSEELDFRYHRIRRAEEELTIALLKFVPQFLEKIDPFLPQDEILEWAWDHFTSEVLELDEFQDDPLFEGVFLPWFFYVFRPSPEAGQTSTESEGISDSDPRSLGEAYLEENGSRLDSFSRSLLEALTANPFTFFRILPSPSPKSIVLLDLLTDARIEVAGLYSSAEKLGGGVIFGRTFTLEGITLFSGLADRVLNPETEIEVLMFRDEMDRLGNPITVSRAQLDEDIRLLFFQFENRWRKPRIPQMVNTDGDPLVWTKVYFDLLCEPIEAFDALAFLCVSDTKEMLLERGKLDADGRLQSIEFDWTKRGNSQHASWDNTILGKLEIAGNQLLAEVNSEKRAQLIRKKILKALGEKAAFVRSVSESMQRKLEKESLPRKRGSIRESEELMALPEIQAKLREMRDQHWKEWLDSPIPALGDITPREAVLTARGRQSVEALLRQFRWHGNEGGNAFDPDVDALRRELGLEEL